MGKPDFLSRASRFILRSMRTIGMMVWMVLIPAITLGQALSTLPDGFVRVTVGERAVITPSEQAQAAEAALRAIEPPELPTTLPADLVARLRDQRGAIIDRIQRDLLIEDRTAIEAFYDEELLPAIVKYEQASLDVAYVWSPRDRLKEALKSGWSNPRFYYNRAADEIMINTRLDLDLEATGEQAWLPALHDPGATDAQRREILVKAIRDAERGIAEELASRAQLQVHLSFAQFIDSRLQETLTKPDQAWLRLGLSGALAAEYAAMASSIDAIAFIRVVVTEPPRTPVHAKNIDLLNPTSLSELREQYVQPYLQGMRRKSTAVVFDWMTQADEGAVSDILRRIQTERPADGAAIVAIIRETTGIDLTEKLKPF